LLSRPSTEPHLTSAVGLQGLRFLKVRRVEALANPPWIGARISAPAAYRPARPIAAQDHAQREAGAMAPLALAQFLAPGASPSPRQRGRPHRPAATTLPHAVEIGRESQVVAKRKGCESLGDFHPASVVPASFRICVGGHAKMEGFKPASIDLMRLAETSSISSRPRLLSCCEKPSRAGCEPMRARGRATFLPPDEAPRARHVRPGPVDAAKCLKMFARSIRQTGCVGVIELTKPNADCPRSLGQLLGEAQVPEVPGLVVCRRGARIVAEAITEIAMDDRM